MSALGIIIYSFALWMGLYLLGRNGQKSGMCFAGLGLVTYAIGLAIAILLPEAKQWHFTVAILPLLCWFGAVWQLIPGESRLGLPKRAIYVILVGTVSFFLGVAGLLIPQNWFNSDLVLIAIGVDLMLLGYGIAAIDAHDEGEALLPDALRSLSATTALVIIFGMQITLVMRIENIDSSGMQFLLLSLITTIIVLQVFGSQLQNLLDIVVFQKAPQIQQSRAELQAVANALPRIDASLEILNMDDKEFARLTRRALGHMGNLNRLVSSPLMQLPQIDQRLADRDVADHSLERAAELKQLLTEGIMFLKPLQEGTFGTSDEWRYFNALYFPYVVGLKPYSRRMIYDDLDEDSRAALDWFQSQVPERTLYNWQNAGAKLIAQYLREQTYAKLIELAG